MCSLEKPRMAKAKHKRDDEVDFGQSEWSVTQLVPKKHNTQLFSRFFQPDHTPRCAICMERLWSAERCRRETREKSVKLPFLPTPTTTTPRLDKVVKPSREITSRNKSGSTYRSCVCWPHVPMRALCMCRRRIPTLAVGSAARHVNACWLYIIRGILQLLPASVVHKLGPGDLWGPRCGKIGNCQI